MNPIGDRLVIKEIKQTKTESGLFLPENISLNGVARGKVLNVGAGKVTDKGIHLPMHVREGDEVLYLSQGGTEIKIDNEDLVVISEQYVLAVVG